MSSKPIPAKNGPLLQPTGFGAPFASTGTERSIQPAVSLQQTERLFERTAAHDTLAHTPAETQAGPAQGGSGASHFLKQPADGCLAPLLRRFTGRQ